MDKEGIPPSILHEFHKSLGFQMLNMLPTYDIEIQVMLVDIRHSSLGNMYMWSTKGKKYNEVISLL